MKPSKVKISRSPMRPEEVNHKLANIANMILGTIGTQVTLMSQTMTLNMANYHWLTNVTDTEQDTPANKQLLHKTVKDVNEYCRTNKIRLGLLIIPHTSASDYASDEVCAIPWAHVCTDARLRQTVKSLFERVEADNEDGHKFVRDAKTDAEGGNVL
ncbi:hypothetical protein pEaSNUABM5_00333 [Erwinia phage pEa_SNUABM_5]|uniref:Uncharacterized protein n=1 Tax=Erwinia phage pEa_SNUABM_5 TaxID=2797313 RepID=A0A7T8EPV7_9CAUD|nr:hypothetical protein MPK73_gp333 [Erwinia phage pEa_SNUABM_5]QQO90475.1 hypothetical protein pEaSNUABM5_00333 [Erwinia phage pEa_SNUABM_5]